MYFEYGWLLGVRFEGTICTVCRVPASKLAAAARHRSRRLEAKSSASAFEEAKCIDAVVTGYRVFVSSLVTFGPTLRKAAHQCGIMLKDALCCDAC